MIAQKGFFAHERAKNAVGYASLRDTKEFDTIGRVVRLDNWVAKLPKQDPRFRRSQKFFGKRNMYFVYGCSFVFIYSHYNTHYLGPHFLGFS